MDESEIVKGEKTLIKVDPTLGTIIKIQPSVALVPRKDYFASLCSTIISQQISVTAAAAIFSRFEELTKLNPKKVNELDEDQIKAIGLSRQKASYLKDLAQHFVDNPNVYDHLEKLDDNQVIEDLTKIKGVGVWSAQMFLIFTLARPDVFAPDDVGLQRAIIKLYSYDELPSKENLQKLADKWKPYRTIASLHLWKSLS
jgi:DNA-3-methyladenine glycosylase II